jgi:hypothetical protein
MERLNGLLHNRKGRVLVPSCQPDLRLDFKFRPCDMSRKARQDCYSKNFLELDIPSCYTSYRQCDRYQLETRVLQCHLLKIHVQLQQQQIPLLPSHQPENERISMRL